MYFGLIVDTLFTMGTGVFDKLVKKGFRNLQTFLGSFIQGVNVRSVWICEKHFTNVKAQKR